MGLPRHPSGGTGLNSLHPSDGLTLATWMPNLLTPAEGTTARLQRAAGSGSPVSIPGAREMRASRPVAPPAAADDRSVAVQARAAAIDDRERLEREREGGGAPSERASPGHKTIRSRLWRGVLQVLRP